jgi:hypothetical protein
MGNFQHSNCPELNGSAYNGLLPKRTYSTGQDKFGRPDERYFGALAAKLLPGIGFSMPPKVLRLLHLSEKLTSRHRARSLNDRGREYLLHPSPQTHHERQPG